ncbi:hypothetical protein BASA60_003528 [Batrachochytrium salamandrivorans]|nr:hypothetical protein BASA62_004029 [Batrachochytrium salamandrivorans]KAH6578755.1 hypothetical protein BASA60_003528 [Batrachochytrium salamandrivorans]
MSPLEKRRVVVLVLGDLGHSPRMQNHALSLAQSGFTVDFIGYNESPLRSELMQHSAINVRFLPTPQRIRTDYKMVFIFMGIWRSVSQMISLLWILLWTVPKPEYILVQNPPAIPTLVATKFITFILGVRLIVDWHNFGFSLMSEKFSKNKILFNILKRYEQWGGSSAYLHLCVTEAMAQELKNGWKLCGDVVVVYDRPASHFQVITTQERHNLFSKLDFTDQAVCYFDSTSTATETLITEQTLDSNIVLKPDRPAILVSSTSWTPDEDFGILLSALELYDKEAKHRSEKLNSASPLSKLVMIITGKGPMRLEFERAVSNLNMAYVSIKFAWLTPQDYPTLVASADLGISLHTSSSGMDLPMKIVDMFGCGVPVCTYYYPTVEELVQDKRNGVYFRDSAELSQRLIEIIGNFPNPNQTRAALVTGVKEYRSKSWDMYWREVVLPHIE